MSRKIIAFVLTIIMVICVSSTAFAVDRIAQSPEVADDNKNVYIKIPDEYYVPVAIYDEGEFLGTVCRVPNSIIMPRSSYSINWTVGGGKIVTGSNNYLIGNSTVSYNLSASRSTATDIGFYRTSTSKYFWMNFYSSSTSFSDSYYFSLDPSENMNFAIRNNGIYSADYSGTLTIT